MQQEHNNPYPEHDGVSHHDENGIEAGADSDTPEVESAAPDATRRNFTGNGDTSAGEDPMAPPESGSGNKKQVIVLGIAVLLIVAGGAGGALAYQWWSASSVPYENDELFAGLASALQTVESGKYTFSVSAETREREEGVESVPSAQSSARTMLPFADALTGIGERYGDLQAAQVAQRSTGMDDTQSEPSGFADPPATSPSGGSMDVPSQQPPMPGGNQFLTPGTTLSASIGGTFSANQEASAATRMDFSGELDSQGTTLSFDMDVVATPDEGYVRINEAPSLFLFNFSALSDQWVRITRDDIERQVPVDVESSGTSEDDRQWREQLVTIMQAAQEHDLYDATNEQIETANDSKRYRYTVSLKPENMPAFYETASKQLEEEYGEDALMTYSESEHQELQQLDSPQAEYFREYTTLMIDVRPDGMPTQLMVQNTYAPQQPRANQKVQVDSEFTMELTRINETINVSEPDEYISIQEAQQMMMGDSRAFRPGSGSAGSSVETDSSVTSSGNQQRVGGEQDAFRITDLRQIKTGLELYYDRNGKYPPALEERYLEDTNIMATLPTQPGSGEPYPYNQLDGGESYHLGATVSQDANGLSDDADTMSGSGASMINGSDTTACDGMGDGACYDVTP